MTTTQVKPDEMAICPNCGDNTEGKARDFLIPGKEHQKHTHECYACDLEWVAWMDDKGLVNFKSKH